MLLSFLVMGGCKKNTTGGEYAGKSVAACSLSPSEARGL